MAFRTGSIFASSESSSGAHENPTSYLKYKLSIPSELKPHLHARAQQRWKNGAQRRALSRGANPNTHIRPQVAHVDRYEALREYFNMLDVDNSGTIELKELTKWLPELGMDHPAIREKIANHFSFIDKDGSGEIEFEEFVAGTIDAAKLKHSTLGDEKYMAQFDSEILMFLSLLARSRLMKDFHNEGGNDDVLAPFLQFQRLLRVSQAAVMPVSIKEQGGSAGEAHSPSAATALPHDGWDPMTMGQRIERDALTVAERKQELRRKRVGLCKKIEKRKRAQAKRERGGAQLGGGGSGSDSSVGGSSYLSHWPEMMHRRRGGAQAQRGVGASASRYSGSRNARLGIHDEKVIVPGRRRRRRRPDGRGAGRSVGGLSGGGVGREKGYVSSSSEVYFPPIR